MLCEKDGPKTEYKVQKGYYIPVLKNVFCNRAKLRTSFNNVLEMKSPGEEICQEDIVAAEIGVFEGENARFMLTFAKKLKLYLIDDYSNLVSWTGGPIVSPNAAKQIKDTAELNLNCYNGSKEFVYKSSLLASRDFTDLFFDYVYIDADHEYEAVKADICAWYPKVKKGGILGGHDINMLGIKNAVSEFIVEREIPNGTWGMELGKEPKSDWWIVK